MSDKSNLCMKQMIDFFSSLLLFENIFEIINKISNFGNKNHYRITWQMKNCFSLSSLDNDDDYGKIKKRLMMIIMQIELKYALKCTEKKEFRRNSIMIFALESINWFIYDYWKGKKYQSLPEFKPKNLGYQFDQKMLTDRFLGNFPG